MARVRSFRVACRRFLEGPHGDRTHTIRTSNRPPAATPPQRRQPRPLERHEMYIVIYNSTEATQRPNGQDLDNIVTTRLSAHSTASQRPKATADTTLPTYSQNIIQQASATTLVLTTNHGREAFGHSAAIKNMPKTRTQVTNIQSPKSPHMQVMSKHSTRRP